MRKKKKLLQIWERYISKEIGIEFKACLYFFCILFFYCVYRVSIGSFEASIIHMTEMILFAYGMGYVQVYLLSNFDEAEQFRSKELCYVILCSSAYTAIAYYGRWLERSIMASVAFFLYMMLVYVCAFLVYKTKRRIDEEKLNRDLKAFQERRKQNECN